MPEPPNPDTLRAAALTYHASISADGLLAQLKSACDRLYTAVRSTPGDCDTLLTVTIPRIRNALYARPPYILTPDELLADLHSIPNLTLYDGAFSITTAPITLTYNEHTAQLGPFRLTIPGPDHVALRAIALAPNPSARSSSLTHPHVNGGLVCLGAGHVPLQLALRSGRISDAFSILTAILSTYNPDSPHAALSTFPTAPGASPPARTHCATCGEPTDTTCAACDRPVCDDDHYTCINCGVSCCTECSISNDYGDRYCTACIPRCTCRDCDTLGLELDGDRRCSDCAETSHAENDDDEADSPEEPAPDPSPAVPDPLPGGEAGLGPAPLGYTLIYFGPPRELGIASSGAPRLTLASGEPIFFSPTSAPLETFYASNTELHRQYSGPTPIYRMPADIHDLGCLTPPSARPVEPLPSSALGYAILRTTDNAHSFHRADDTTRPDQRLILPDGNTIVFATRPAALPRLHGTIVALLAAPQTRTDQTTILRSPHGDMLAFSDPPPSPAPYWAIRPGRGNTFYRSDDIPRPVGPFNYGDHLAPCYALTPDGRNNIFLATNVTRAALLHLSPIAEIVPLFRLPSSRSDMLACTPGDPA